jgi:hypothetical protein
MGIREIPVGGWVDNVSITLADAMGSDFSEGLWNPKAGAAFAPAGPAS